MAYYSAYVNPISKIHYLDPIFSKEVSPYDASLQVFYFFSTDTFPLTRIVVRHITDAQSFFVVSVNLNYVIFS